MFKIAMVLLVLAMVYLFYPQHNLYKKESDFSDTYHLQATYYSKDDCVKKGKRFEAGYKCLSTNAWKGIELTSGKPWKELDEDYMVPAVENPFENCIIVTGGGEEVGLWTDGRSARSDPAYSIDAWR